MARFDIIRARRSRGFRVLPGLCMIMKGTGAVEVPEAAWLAMADDPEAEGRFACFLIADIVGNVLWVNEDRGDGLAHYLFPLTAVLEMAAGAGDIWPALMARFPNARMGG